VKPLGQHLQGIPTYAGATIMGDGRVGLILDVVGLAGRAGVVTEAADRTAAVAAGPGANVVARRSLLVFRTPDDGRMAVPLDVVDRLEEFPRTAVEHVGGSEVVQYRGSIMPLVHVSTGLPERRVLPRSDVGSQAGISPTLQVVVHRREDRCVGLVVDAILDIVEETGPVERGSRPGVLGTTIIGERVTELLSLDEVLADAFELLPDAEVTA
jgi:two-component system chemotaxis sensor kinase CheA